jgi:MFS family permease
MSNAEFSTESAGERELTTTRGYAVLRNRDFRFYLSGRLIALIGQQMLGMTVLWEVNNRTHSSMYLGLIGLTQAVPMFLFTLPAGHVADNYSRKCIIMLMTFIAAGSSLGLAVVSAFQAPIIWMYVCLFIFATTRTFMAAASASFLPSLVERKDLSRAVNWSAMTFQLSSILGPTAAGALIGMPGWAHHRPAIVYAFNVLAALIFCGLVTQVRHHRVIAIKEKLTFKTLLTGFRFVFANKIVVRIITLDMLAVLFGGATALLPVYAEKILMVGPIGLGFLMAALPMGAVLCTFILAHRPPLQKAGRAMLWAVAAFGVATIGFGLSHWFWLSFLMLFICGAVDNVSVVVRHTLVQLLTPDDKRGRVSAVNNLFIGTSNELGEFESGFVAQLFGETMGHARSTGAVISVVSGGIGTVLVVIVVAIFWPEIRKYGRLDA